MAPGAAPALLGQLIGTALAQISMAPKGFVPGDGVEEVLARAQFYLDRGQLTDCLKELEQVQGYSKVTTNALFTILILIMIVIVASPIIMIIKNKNKKKNIISKLVKLIFP